MLIPEISPAGLGLHTFDIEPAAAEGNTADRSAAGHAEVEKTALPLLFPMQASHLWFLNTLPPPEARKSPERRTPPSPE